MRSSLHVTVLLCLVGVVFGQYMPVCDPTNYTGPPLPNLPMQFSVVIEANFGQNNRTSDIKEYVDEVGRRGRFEISSTNSGTNTIVGIFNFEDGEISVIPDVNTGDACTVKRIADPSARPFLPTTPLFGFQDVGGSIHIGTVSRFFQLLRGTNATWLGVEVVRGIPCNLWRTCTVMENNSYTLDYYFATEDWDFALGNGPTPVQVILTRGEAESLKDTYSFVSFDAGPRSVPDEVFTVPIGLVCTGRTGRPLPPFPEYFSLSLETVQKTRQSVVVYKEFYDSPNGLSRVDVYYDGRQGSGTPGPISLIRDYARSIDYIINRQFNNCTVIPLNSEAVYFRTLEAPSEFLTQTVSLTNLIFVAQLFPYSYQGVTNIRGVDVDAWIGMQPDFQMEIRTSTPPVLLELTNGTWEIFYTRPGWRITNDRTVSTEPVLWRIKIDGNLSFTFPINNTPVTTYASGAALYDIFDFSSQEPDFDIFDVSTCFSPSEYHILSLAVPGHEDGLNFSQLRRNIRSAIVRYSTIQPLQVGNIQITGENGTHIFVSLHISNPTELAATNDSKTADQILQMIQRGTINGRLPFQISTGMGMTMVNPLLLNVNPQDCDSSCSGLKDGQAAGIGIGLLIVGLLCGILGTLLVLLVIKLCRSKSPKDAAPKGVAVNYEKQENEEVAIK